MIGIVDEPVLESQRGLSDFLIDKGALTKRIAEVDNLGIAAHAVALANFITRTDTPITIGVQGEWGSGKTSLLNTIHQLLGANEENKQVWVNSWEHSLLSSPEEALLKITNEIITEMLSADPENQRADNIRKVARTIFSGALRVGATATLGATGGQIADEVLNTGEKNVSIKELRNELAKLTNEVMTRATNKFEKIIIYIDDLDRIEPKDAVRLLELLKNIFSIPGCIFILAIDYQVVVKGLEHKFGKRSSENEWEFRAFFDKIIQLPFMMPLGQYDIGKYVTSLLVKIEYMEEEELDTHSIQEIVTLSIGGNPRSLKRLVNSLSLIGIFAESKAQFSSEEDIESELDSKLRKTLLFSLVCLQIAYPDIYSLLVKKPDFENWDDDWAYRVTQQKELEDDKFQRQFDAATKTEDFDENWEQALFRACYLSPRYRTRAGDISNLLSLIKDEILKDEESKGAIVAEILSQTAVTSVTATDEPQPQKQAFTRTFYEGFKSWINIMGVNGFSKNALDLASTVHPMLLAGSEECKFSETGGCTYYHSKKKIGSLNIKSKRSPRLAVIFLKDFRQNYRIPKINGIETQHIRNFQLGKPTTSAFGEYYRVILPVGEEIPNINNILKSLVETNIEIIKDHKDKILRISELEGKIADGDHKAINYALEILKSDYTYDAQLR
jgi:hypothetical protein